MDTHNSQETQNAQPVPIRKSLLSLLQITVEPIFLLLFFCFSLTGEYKSAY